MWLGLGKDFGLAWDPNPSIIGEGLVCNPPHNTKLYPSLKLKVCITVPYKNAAFSDFQRS